MKIFILCTLFSAAAWAQGPKFTSLSANFNQFVKEGAGADFETQLMSWQSNIESKFPQVYLQVFADGNVTQLEAKRRAAAKLAFPFIFSHVQEIQEQFRIFDQDGRAVVESLTKKYPEADLSDVQVIGLPSLDNFNGKVITVDGHPYVLFGMDMIAHIIAQPDFMPGAILLNKTAVIVAHEFSHALHAKLSDFSTDDTTQTPLLGPLWQEGLAQVNSQMLVPGTSLDYVYMEKVLAEKCTPDHLKNWAKIYQEDMKLNTEDTVVAAYAKWFLMRPTALAAFGVYRAGYCLGYNVILLGLRQHTMSEILKMSRLEAYQFEQKALVEMSQP